MPQIITLTTDFGLIDNFTGVMKGVIYSINPDVTIVDITHNIERHNILQCAINIKNTFRYFPKGTIHLAVVDPGVGTERLPLIVQSNGQYFIGPDNGIFTYIYQDKKCKVFKITSAEHFLDNISASFHGRDIFSPVAANLSKIQNPERFGKAANKYVSINLKVPKKQNNYILGEIIYVDSFGNMTTNIENKDVKQSDEILIDDISIGKVSSSYSDAEVDNLLAIRGSSGNIEIAVGQGSAADRYKSLPYVKILKK